ncbi:phage tail assembly protein [Vibrio kasasachensis]|uniref:Phage tail assembly protein n=1 Tax=Vibrio marinisediminis TaxID=2758441 RepID=A0A7W2FMN7_9VIBR|nr:phage tail assembly protein [Vibrio marinisediminis]MBA5760834.1 phage tail assembly protein [Vibrio marinisediminis]
MTNPIKDKGQTKVVTLAVPIEKEVKGETVTIETVELSKPHSGHLRGVNLNDICQADFDAGKTVIPRISELDERDMLNLDPENWAPLLTTLASFFVGTGR